MSKVAIIIPLYNKADTVARTIASARSQSFKDIEIVVVDDGSTDNPRPVVEEAFLREDGTPDPRCKYVYQDNAGVAHARNNGVLRHSIAPFVMCLDSDDAIERNYLAGLLPELEKDRSLGIVYTALRYILPDGKSGVSKWPTNKFDGAKQMAGQNQIPTAALTRRTVWERLGGQRQRYAPLGAGAEDGDFWLRAVSYGFGAKYVQPLHDGMFVYSWRSGLVSGNPNYREVDYRAWSPWTRNPALMPTPSQAPPRLFSHPARQYDQPTVSVIVPVGPGHARHLVNCLDSLDAQIFKRWEAIVIFDVGSKEYEDLLSSGELDYIANTWPFCRFASTGSGTTLARDVITALDIYEAKASGEHISLLSGLKAGLRPAGAGVARNIGIELARAPLLLFLDADDWLVPSAMKEMVDAHVMTGNIIYTDHLAIAHIKKEDIGKVDGKVVAYNEHRGEAFIEQRVGDYDCRRAMEQPYTDGRPPYVICNVTSLVPTKWVRALGGFSTKINSWEDVLLFWQLAWQGKCFTRISKPLLVYRYGTGGRRELGRKNAKVLLKYLSDLSKRTKKMGCGCNQAKQTVYNEASSGGDDMITLNLSRGGILNVSDSDVVLVEFNPPDKGDKLRYGLHQWPGGQIKYGYFSGGETFYVHKKDIEADTVLAQAQNRPAMFVPVTISDANVSGTPEEVVELDPPEEIAEAPVNEFLPEDYVEALGAVTPADPDDYFPEPEVEVQDSPGEILLADLDLNELTSAHRYLAILAEEGIVTAVDLIEYHEDSPFGVSGLKGIGPKVEGVLLDAAREALGL